MKLSRLKVSKDNRGSFIETFKLPNDGQISYLIINPHETRGNHYHERKTETFVVMYGSAVMRVRDRTTGNVLTVEVSGYQPMTIKVSPNHTHSITATDEGAVVIIWCDEQYNKKDPDTIGEEV